MPGIDLEVMVHRLEVDPAHQPVELQKRNFISKLQKAIAELLSIIKDKNALEQLPGDVPIVYGGAFVLRVGEPCPLMPSGWGEVRKPRYRGWCPSSRVRCWQLCHHSNSRWSI